jgi:hypothetical protein
MNLRNWPEKDEIDDSEENILTDFPRKDFSSICIWPFNADKSAV